MRSLIALVIIGIAVSACNKNSSNGGVSLPPIYHKASECPTQKTVPHLDDYKAIVGTPDGRGLVMEDADSSQYNLLIDGREHSFTDTDKQIFIYRGGCREGGVMVIGQSGDSKSSIELVMTKDGYKLTKKTDGVIDGVEVYRKVAGKIKKMEAESFDHSEDQ